MAGSGSWGLARKEDKEKPRLAGPGGVSVWALAGLARASLSPPVRAWWWW